MAYYVRAFCKSAEPVPPLARILQWVRGRGPTLSLDPRSGRPNLEAEDWNQAELIYKEGKLPLIVEVSRANQPGEALLHEEIGEFEEFLEDVPESENKRKVLEHLAATRYIVAVQLPASDIDQDGYAANGWFMAYFAENCKGMIQADGEGFYEGNELIVELA
jgi:hypothetical protein